jgi:hypothetical protein
LDSWAGRNGRYDQQATQHLIDTLVANGGYPNTWQSGAGRGVGFDRSGFRHTVHFGGHDNHIHVCFRDNAENRQRCANTQFDTNLCPELNHPSASPPALMAEEPSEDGRTAADVVL